MTVEKWNNLKEGTLLHYKGKGAKNGQLALVVGTSSQTEKTLGQTPALRQSLRLIEPNAESFDDTRRNHTIFTRNYVHWEIIDIEALIES